MVHIFSYWILSNMEADLYTLQIVGSGEWRVHLRKYFLAVTPGNPPALCRIATNQQDKIPYLGNIGAAVPCNIH